MKQIPNLLTLTNLFCGCCALVFTLSGDPITAAWFTLGSFLCDYADGMAARALGVASPLGKELDSLADVVSFGAVPGAMLYILLGHAICRDTGCTEATGVQWAALPAFVLSAFSGLRLARFNLDTRQANYFIGLSTPACTVLVLGLMLGAHQDRFGLREMIENQWFLYALVATLAILLNSEIPMFGLKIKRLHWRSNLPNLAFLALLLIFIFLIKELALTAIIVAYILLSVFLKNKVTTP